MLGAVLMFSGCTDSTSQPATSPTQEPSGLLHAREEAESQRFAEQKAEEERNLRQQQAYSRAITELLQEDARNSRTSTDYTQIASGMRRLDLSQCPRDFAVAYVDHIHDWEKAAEIQKLRKELLSDDNVNSTIIAEGLRDIFGSEHDAHPIESAVDAEKQLKAAGVDASAQITASFNVVERLAIAYGATLP